MKNNTVFIDSGKYNPPEFDAGMATKLSSKFPMRYLGDVHARITAAAMAGKVSLRVPHLERDLQYREDWISYVVCTLGNQFFSVQKRGSGVIIYWSDVKLPRGTYPFDEIGLNAFQRGIRSLRKRLKGIFK